MEWLDALKDQVVGLDTTPLIYFLEENTTYLPLVQPFFRMLDRGELQVITSTVSLLEVLVHPFREKNMRLIQEYRDILLNAEGLTTLALTPEIAELAARLRSEHNLRTPDAIQVATALHAGASHFLTNDAALAKLPNVEILVLKDFLD